jgi:hypothetical protein
MAKLQVNKIRDLALRTVGENLGGIHYGELVKKIATSIRSRPIFQSASGLSGSRRTCSM